MSQILFVDDEEFILKSMQRLFATHDWEILTASSGEDALALFDKQNIAVLVSDQRMPGMLGTELIERVKQRSPETVRIILSGYTDLAYLLEAINKGEIFRFIVKPWDEETLIGHVEAALSQYRLNVQQRDREEQMFLALAQTIELKDSYTKGHCDRVAQYAMGIARELGLSQEVIKDICHGAWLHDCGKIGTPEVILNFPGRIDENQYAQIKKHPDNGATIAEKANLPERVRNIIRFHHERVDGAGYPLGLHAEQIPLEAKIVSVADVYDSISTDRPYRKAMPPKEVEEIMRASRGCALDAQLVDLLLDKILPEFQDFCTQ